MYISPSELNVFVYPGLCNRAMVRGPSDTSGSCCLGDILAHASRHDRWRYSLSVAAAAFDGSVVEDLRDHLASKRGSRSDPHEGGWNAARIGSTSLSPRP
jgi:hypothetical protein